MRAWAVIAGSLMAATVATGAMAAGPFRIADVGPDALAVQDLGSKTEVSEHVVQVWETQLFEQPRAGAAAFDEQKTLREFDCEKHAVRTKDVVAYRAGRPVSQASSAGWTAWKTIAPAANGELSLLTACCPHPEVSTIYGSMDELKEMMWGRRTGPQS